MAIRYFRKHSPNVKLWMFGRPIQFAAFGKFGYLKSDDPEIANHASKSVDEILAQIDLGIRQGVGGVEEISAAQYDSDFLKKKAQTILSPKSNWREEIGGHISPDTLLSGLAQVARPAPVSDAEPTVPDSRTVSPTVRSLRERATLGHR